MADSHVPGGSGSGHPHRKTSMTDLSRASSRQSGRRPRYQFSSRNPFGHFDERSSQQLNETEAEDHDSDDEATRLIAQSQDSHHQSNTVSNSRERRPSGNESLLTVPGVRFRTSIRDGHKPSPGRSDAYASGTVRRSIAVGPSSYGRDFDSSSRKFSLAGPQPVETVAANEPYVDPGYAQLNPAFEQPSNVRPVWSLAKPLPRVIRPSMVPTVSELKVELLAKQKEDDQQDQFDPSLEEGRIEPTLKYDKIAPLLDTVREERELQLCETLGRSPLQSLIQDEIGTRTGAFSPRHESVIAEEEEEEDHGEPALREQFPQLSEAILRMHEEKFNKLSYENAVPLRAYEASIDEVHNLHTYWSVIRLRFREPLAELLAITVQLTLGFSVNLAMTTSRGRAGVGDTSDWGWGLATMIAIYIAGGISGAHLNPSMSIMLCIYRGFPSRKLPIYIAAQMLGAFLATLIAFGIFQPGLVALRDGSPDLARVGTAANFITFPREAWIDGSTAWLTEYTGTAILAATVLALGDNENAPPGAGMNAFIIGLVIVVLSMAFGPNTGIAMNPARDFGPRVALRVLGYANDDNGNDLFADGYWFKTVWLATISGAITGGFLYDAAIFVGGESPVNYPPKRLKRATRRWKKGWVTRLRKSKNRVRRLVGNKAPEGTSVKDDMSRYGTMEGSRYAGTEIA